LFCKFENVIIWLFLQKSLEDAKTQTQKEMADIEAKMEDIKVAMTKLKAELYAKFGSHINLEDDEEE